MSEKIINKHFTTHLMPYLSVVLETKLKPPSQRGLLIARPRLASVFSATESCSVLTVTAPAGYGKTSLLAQIFTQAQSEQSICAWFTLDKTDNDMVRFAHALVEAVRKSSAGFGRDILGLIERGANPSSDTLMTLFINEIAQLDQPVRIFIDDFHLITNSDLLDTVSELFMRSPASVKWIVAMRHAPLGVSLGRLRALGRLHELDVDDLRFTLAESREFFAKTTKIPLRNPDLALLADRTEGWVAGLQLASLSLQKVQNPQHWIHDLSGEYRDIANFLTEEVLRTLDEPVREFLLQTSILTRLNRGLCAAVTEMKDCHALLEQVIASHIFIFSLDETDDWYRYHHLFAEFLDRRLREADPDKYRVFHSRASLWFEQHHFYLDAIHHACCAEDKARAAALLDHVSETLFSTGHVTTLEEQAARIPYDVLKRQPRLMLDLAWQHIMRWDFEKGAAMLDLISEELARHRELHATISDKKILLVESGLAPKQLHYLEGKLKHREMMLAAISDDLAKTKIACEAWLSANYPSDPAMHMLTSVQILLQSARRDHFEVGETLGLAAAMHEICVEHNVLYGSVYHDALVGITLRMQAEYTEAQALFKNALNDATELHGRLSSISSTPGLLLADLYYTQNRIEFARDLVNEHLGHCEKLGLSDQLIAGYLTKTRVHVFDGNLDVAFECLNEGIKQAARFAFSRLETHLIAERVRLHCLLGDAQQAAECGRQSGLMGPPINLKPDENASTATCVMAIAWSRLATLRGQSAVAIRLLKQWWQFLSDRGCWEPALQTGLCLTAITAENGDHSAARGVLQTCLHLKGAEHSVRFFLDEGQPIQKLLRELQSENASDSADLITRLLTAFSNDPMQHFPRSQTMDFSLQEALLKEREVEILEMAADDRSNSEIATRLSLSPNTVKWYWQQIFTKLDVHRRGSAVSKARELGFLQ